MRPFLSINSQVLLAVAGISAVTTAAFAYLVIGRVQARADVLAFEAARENATLIAAIASRGLDRTGASFDGASQRLRAASAWLSMGEEHTTRIQLFNHAAELRFDTTDTEEHRAAGAAVRAALAGQALAEPVVLAGSRVAAAAPVRRGLLGAEVLGAVRVIRPALGVRTILANIAPEVAALALLCVLLASVGAILVGRSIGQPILRLTRATRRVAAGDRTAALPKPKGREVAELTSAFEEMRRELEDKHLIERLTQDLSHELKNPIAAVAALAEALEEGGLSDPEAGPRLVSQIRSAAARLEGVVSDVLALSRLEARGVDREGEVAITELLAEAVTDLAPTTTERGISINVDHQRLPSLRGDAVWLRRALTNLLANAVENTASGEVTVRAVIARQQLEIRIANPGEVAEALRPKLFERFVSRRTDGTGLGLAIARSVAEAHGGTVSLEESGPPEVVIRLRLPLASAHHD